MTLDRYPKQGTVLKLAIGDDVARFRVVRGNPGRVRLRSIEPGVMMATGLVFPLPVVLDDGAETTRLWKVEKSNPLRTYMVPLTPIECGLVEAMQRGQSSAVREAATAFGSGPTETPPAVFGPSPVESALMLGHWYDRLKQWLTARRRVA